MKPKSLLGLLLVCAIVVTARADDCTSGCGAQTSACATTARGDKSACRRTCRHTSPRGTRRSCLAGCIASFHGARADCDSEHSGCVERCTPAGPPPSNPCPGACGRALAGCVHGVITRGRSCVEACPGHPSRGRCVRDCVATAQQDLAGCRASFQACAGGCPGSPSGAFLDTF